VNFVSFAFVLLLAVVLAARFSVGRSKTSPAYKAVLIAASCVFYAWHVPIYITALLASTGVDYFAARGIVRAPAGSRRRKLFLLASLVANLGMLAVFKYADFGIDAVNGILRAIGGTGIPHLDLILPIGISFYTFQSLSYTIDVYRGVLLPARSFSNFFLYVSFFPQLVAGPIVRAKDFLYQIDRRRRPHLKAFTEGGFLIVRGYFLKMVCADNIAPFVDEIYGDGFASADSGHLLAAAFLFSCQIFCDFAGYSSIARGLAYWLGFRLPVNFDLPFIAGSFGNFWERWHITLSQWLRQYLYFSLGGNRVSRTRMNLMIVMLLGGLWHGASWTFVVWGLLHGLALVVERRLGLRRVHEQKTRLAVRVAWLLAVQLWVLLTWIFFRSDSLVQALSFLGGIEAMRFSALSSDALFALAFSLPVILMHARGLLVAAGRAPTSGPREKAVLAGFMAVATLTLYGQSNAFIYFQF
jgi:alginate O-acetyltransferase complex protein AlgI